MNYIRVVLLVLAFGCAVPWLQAQKKNKDKGEEMVVRASGRKGYEKRADEKPTLIHPNQEKKQATTKNEPEFEIKARIESERIALAYGLEDKVSQNKLLKACRKYYKARELLEADYGAGLENKQDKKNQKKLRQRTNILEREFGKELRRILPES